MKATANRGFLGALITWMLVCLPTSACLSTPAGAAAEEAATLFDIRYPKQRLPAPDFSLPVLGGGLRALGDYRGKVVLIHFWATFCAPCLEEMPDLEAFWQRYRDQGFVVLGVAADRGSERVVREFTVHAGVNFPVLLDPDGVVRNRYEVLALPVSYLVGRDGKLSGRVVGSREWNSTEARKVIEMLLAPGMAD
jgi:peroxiredoxin